MAPRRPGRQGGGGGRHGSRGLWVHRSAQTQPVWRGVVRRGGANTGPGRHPPLPPASHSGRPGKVRGPVPAGRRQVHRGGDSSRPVLTLVQKRPPCGGGLGGAVFRVRNLIGALQEAPRAGPDMLMAHRRGAGAAEEMSSQGPCSMGNSPGYHPSSARWARGCCACARGTTGEPPPDFLLWSPGACWLDWGMNVLRNGKFSLESSWCPGAGTGAP